MPNNWKMIQDRAMSQCHTNSKSYIIYRTAPFSTTFIDPYPRFQGHAII